MDMGFLLKNAKKMQEQVQKIQEELSAEVVEASTGGGMVTVTANGQQEILSVKIEPEVVSSGDVRMLEDLLLSSVNEALRKSQALMKEKMASLTGGMKIPGMF